MGKLISFGVLTLFISFAYIVYGNIKSMKADHQLVKTQSDLNLYKSSLQLYELDNEDFPSEQEGLNILTMVMPGSKYKYLSSLRADPQGNPYVYSVSSNEKVVVQSLGKNGVNNFCKADDLCIEVKKRVKI